MERIRFAKRVNACALIGSLADLQQLPCHASSHVWSALLHPRGNSCNFSIRRVQHNHLIDLSGLVKYLTTFFSKFLMWRITSTTKYVSPSPRHSAPVTLQGHPHDHTSPDRSLSTNPCNKSYLVVSFLQSRYCYIFRPLAKSPYEDHVSCTSFTPRKLGRED
jgi:hypothetical protein